MFPVHVNDGSKPIPTDDICYIIGKDGIYLKKKLGMVESLIKVDNISILQPVEQYGKIHLPKIPGKLMAKVVGFFREAYDKYSGEAASILYFNEKTKQYKVVIPEQKVSGAAVDYEVDLEEKMPNFRLVGTIHSHANFGAFHSGTDSADEKNFDGLHITVGNVKGSNGSFSLSTSIVINGTRFTVPDSDYIENVIHEEEKKEVTVQGVTYGYTWSSSNNKMYTFDASKITDEDFEFNPKWMEKVSERTYQYQQGGKIGFHYDDWWGGGAYTYGGGKYSYGDLTKKHMTYDDQDGEHRSFIRAQDGYRGIHAKGKKFIYRPNGGRHEGNGIIRFPETNPQNGQMNLFRLDESKRSLNCTVPCEKCIHRDLKLDMIIEDIDDQKEEMDDDKAEAIQIVKQMYPKLSDKEVAEVVEGMHFEEY
jgi:PRTRC genetic system protein A